MDGEFGYQGPAVWQNTEEEESTKLQNRNEAKILISQNSEIKNYRTEQNRTFLRNHNLSSALVSSGAIVRLVPETRGVARNP